jgi:hypothetical protein
MRTLRPIGLTLAAAALLVACGGPQPAGSPSATDRCGDVEFPTLQFGSHLIGDTEPPVPYSSTPPTSGWHVSGAVPQGGVSDAPLSEPQQVSVLEAGGVVISHNGVPDADLAAVEALVEADFADRAVLTPYDRIDDGTIAITSWGAVQRCDGVDLDAVAAYVLAYGEAIEAHD